MPRPKASVTDEKKHLWISKFPSAKDQFNVGGWEMIASNLGAQAGILMPESMIQKYNSDHYTYSSKRFDRNKEGKRIHFASAMTLLDYTNGQSGVSISNSPNLLPGLVLLLMRTLNNSGVGSYFL
ncbi:MAG: HipA domain-containing protein [Agriterribacter sp.]